MVADRCAAADRYVEPVRIWEVDRSAAVDHCGAAADCYAVVQTSVVDRFVVVVVILVQALRAARNVESVFQSGVRVEVRRAVVQSVAPISVVQSVVPILVVPYEAQSVALISVVQCEVRNVVRVAALAV